MNTFREDPVMFSTALGGHDEARQSSQLLSHVYLTLVALRSTYESSYFSLILRQRLKKVRFAVTWCQ